jgi:hypothetical protein
VQQMMIKALQAGNNPDSNMSFFAGIVPYLKSFDDDDLLDFQMGVLQLISKIKCNKKRRIPVMSHGLRLENG